MKSFKRICKNCGEEITLFEREIHIRRLRVQTKNGLVEFRIKCPLCKASITYHIPEEEITNWIAARVWYVLIDKQTEKYFMGYLQNIPLWTVDKEKASRHPTKTAERFKRRLECQSFNIVLEKFMWAKSSIHKDI